MSKEKSYEKIVLNYTSANVVVLLRMFRHYFKNA